MLEKGNKLAHKRYVFRKSESNKTGVVSTVSVSDLDLDPKTDYFVEISKDNGPNGKNMLTTMKTTTSSSANQINISTSVITDVEGIAPGVSAGLTFYEVVSTKNTDNDTNDNTDLANRLLGVANVAVDNTASDGCDSRLHCQAASRYLDNQGKEGLLKFRNKRNNKETVAESHSNYQSNKNCVHTSIDVRQNIDTEPGDEIELFRIDGGEDIADTRTAERIEEMHEMVSEMYEAYLEVND